MRYFSGLPATEYSAPQTSQIQFFGQRESRDPAPAKRYLSFNDIFSTSPKSALKTATGVCAIRPACPDEGHGRSVFRRHSRQAAGSDLALCAGRSACVYRRSNAYRSSHIHDSGEHELPVGSRARRVPLARRESAREARCVAPPTWGCRAVGSINQRSMEVQQRLNRYLRLSRLFIASTRFLASASGGTPYSARCSSVTAVSSMGSSVHEEPCPLRNWVP